MKIGLLLDDTAFSRLDLTTPELGNPGIGGTEYEFLMLAKYLGKNKNVYVALYHFNETNRLPSTVEQILITKSEEILERFNNDKLDIIIFRQGRNTEWYKSIEKQQIRSICWAHNFLSYEELKSIVKTTYVKRLVFCGKQQYDYYIDHPVIRKAQYIYNMYNARCLEYRRNINYKNNVTYTGSLIWLKGFHVLAQYWKTIVAAVPDAKLHVIGSGCLYNRDVNLGSYGIADEVYEKQFMPYLTDEKGNILDSVVFHGVMGAEKIEVYKDTAVGVMNPTAATETFGISAVEMSALGIPIVTKAAKGLLDTVIDKSTGLTFRKNKEIPNLIISLLMNHDYNEHLGTQGKEFVTNAFDPEKLVLQWIACFQDILDQKVVKFQCPDNFYNESCKWLRIVIYYLRKVSAFRWIPSLHAVNYVWQELRKRLKRILIKKVFYKEKGETI